MTLSTVNMELGWCPDVFCSLVVCGRGQDLSGPVIYQLLDQRSLSFDLDLVIFTIRVACQTQVLFPIATSNASFFVSISRAVNRTAPSVRVLRHPCHSRAQVALRLPHSCSTLVLSGASIMPGTISLVSHIYTLFSLIEPVS